MDEYPPCSLDYCLPLAVFLGLPSTYVQQSALEPQYKEGAVLIRSEPPPVEGDQVAALVQHIRDSDASGLPWNKSATASVKYKFRFRTAGRTYLLPPRLARLPDDAEIPPSQAVLHSPFSPLSPSSSLYPDGLIDTAWLKKHQELVPSAFVCLYSLTADATLATLHDNKIKSDIGVLRNALAQSGCKSKLAVIVLVDNSSGVQERLENIRRGSGLDPKSFFASPTSASPEELGRILDNALTTIYAQAIDYYRDHGKQARKKRGRGAAPQPTVPPTSGTSQTLSLAGWQVRYDFKSAIWAEYRQELDVALRSFELAYENLFGPEVIEVIPSWSPRWNQARLLADIIAVRCIRCLLWSEQHTAAVRRWQFHRDRVTDLVDRLGHGTTTYGWEAWEARWSVVMANLIEKADIPDFDHSFVSIYLPAEKNALAERLQPWELLHHPGYWYRLAARHSIARRRLAYSMSEDDRRSPSQSPASKLASKAFTYDNYMCPEPYEELPLASSGVNHSQIILDQLLSAQSYFIKKRQRRLAAEVSMECAKEFATVKDWEHVVKILRPFWDEGFAGHDGWPEITEDMCWILRSAAVETAQADLVVSIDWELMNQKYPKRSKWHYNLAKSLEGIQTAKPFVEIKDEIGTSFLTSSFVFRHEEGKAGEICQAQLSITSNASTGSAPVVLESISVQFKGSIKPIILTHRPDDDARGLDRGHTSVRVVSLQEQPSGAEFEVEVPAEVPATPQMAAPANLTLEAGQITVFEMKIPLREPGEASASSLRLTVNTDAFKLTQSSGIHGTSSGHVWYTGTTRRRITRPHPESIRILPRPPKMAIKHIGLLDQYYTNETIELPLDIINEEDAHANAKVEILVLSEDPPNFKLRTADGTESRALADDDVSRLNETSLGLIKASEHSRIVISIVAAERTTAYTLTIKVSYNLATDPGTTIIQTATSKIAISSPFEANYELLPRLHADPWPSLFDHEGVQNPAAENHGTSYGMAQAWCLVTRYASFASETLKVVSLSVEMAPAHGVQCRVSKKTPSGSEDVEVSPRTIEEARFDVEVRRVSLDERNPIALDASFVIEWTRSNDGSGITNRTLLAVPRLPVFNTEPRVLASMRHSSSQDQGGRPLLLLDITIENPSNHFLTFGLTMDPSDEFAFSGAKQTTLNLLPISRRTVVYRMLPLVKGGSWIRPNLTVRDKYFQKVLRIVPTEGMKTNKDGFLVWVPPTEEE
ncbi:Gryzun, putative trafficking through golgi-domain-containing protein [Coniella lustricola]|uniref:Gryzun, putative trafficking through golgi-domain-containing protein n=1 Tax=Coniella lustricola TaxID=2025994 RepID=A0A2T2ZU03_9PEZI|nr:Gryzun, putative trafficking through golgi-domain-containing protein [Coniella lustricola]